MEKNIFHRQSVGRLRRQEVGLCSYYNEYTCPLFIPVYAVVIPRV